MRLRRCEGWTKIFEAERTCELHSKVAARWVLMDLAIARPDEEPRLIV